MRHSRSDVELLESGRIVVNTSVSVVVGAATKPTNNGRIHRPRDYLGLRVCSIAMAKWCKSDVQFAA